MHKQYELGINGKNDHFNIHKPFIPAAFSFPFPDLFYLLSFKTFDLIPISSFPWFYAEYTDRLIRGKRMNLKTNLPKLFSVKCH